MSRELTKKRADELRPEYDLSSLKGGVRGKYYRRATAGTNLVLIAPDLAKAFPDTDSVNRALRTLLEAATAATGAARRRGQKPDERPHRTAKRRRHPAPSR